MTTPNHSPITGPCIHTLQSRIESAKARAIAGTDRLSGIVSTRRTDLMYARHYEDGSGELVARAAQRLALAEAREEGYRAAVADLLGALEVGL